MRNQWYSDKRDLVKWGVLLHLASEFRAERILQVAYFRANGWGALEIDGSEYRLPKTVLDHFRNIGNAAKIVRSPEILVIDEMLTDRRTYMKKILKVMAASSGKRCIVFLDPDTGLAPRNPNLNHVLDSELLEIWQQMHGDDVLVFYQHETNKMGKPWIELKRTQFAKALGLKIGMVKKASGTEIARDVVFFFCQKAT